MSKTLKQSEVADCVPGLTKKDLDTWRARGFLDGIGLQTATGRWRYTLEDACALILAQQFRVKGYGPQQAVIKGHTYRLELATHIADAGAALKIRYIAILYTATQGATLPLAKIEELNGERYASVIVLDLAGIADDVSPIIRHMVQAT